MIRTSRMNRNFKREFEDDEVLQINEKLKVGVLGIGRGTGATFVATSIARLLGMQKEKAVAFVELRESREETEKGFWSWYGGSGLDNIAIGEPKTAIASIERVTNCESGTVKENRQGNIEKQLHELLERRYAQELQQIQRVGEPRDTREPEEKEHMRALVVGDSVREDAVVRDALMRDSVIRGALMRDLVRRNSVMTDDPTRDAPMRNSYMRDSLIYESIGGEKRFANREFAPFYSLVKKRKYIRGIKNMDAGINWALMTSYESKIGYALTALEEARLINNIYGDVIICDMGSELKNSRLDEMDKIICVVDPMPSRLIGCRAVYQKLKEEEHKGKEIIWIINKANGGINKKCFREYIKIKKPITIPLIRPEYFYTAEYNCRLPFEQREIKNKVRGQFEEIVKHIIAG